MAATDVMRLIPLLFSSKPPFLMDYPSKLNQPTFSLLFSFAYSLLFLLLLVIFLYRRIRKTEHFCPNLVVKSSFSKTEEENERARKSNVTHLNHSPFLEILRPESPKWATLLGGDGTFDEPNEHGSALDRDRLDSGGEEFGKKNKRKKKRGKKKQPDSPKSNADEGSDEKFFAKDGLGGMGKQELVCLYPFTSSSSVTQRKIKQQYDQLVKSHDSNGLTLAEVGQFVNCLIEAKNELQLKSKVIKRKFTITEALLFKADRSSLDRIRQQIYKLELEQKRLEEDVFVYNWLQQQLKLSPAYKKMLQVGACMELRTKPDDELLESTDTKFAEMSFEELLAQEKKDSFWHRNGKRRSFTG